MMQDLIHLLEQRQGEIAEAINGYAAERAKLVDHIDHIDQSIRDAEKDHQCVTNAIIALNPTAATQVAERVMSASQVHSGVPHAPQWTENFATTRDR